MARIVNSKFNKGKKAVTVSKRTNFVKRSQRPRLTYKEGGVTSTVTRSSSGNRSESDRLLTTTRTYFRKGVAVKAVKLLTSISTIAVTLFDILSDSDTLSDAEFDADIEIEVDENIEAAADIDAHADIDIDTSSEIEDASVAAELEAYSDMDIDYDSDIEDTASTLSSNDISLPRTPAPFPMPGPDHDSSSETPSVESEDEDDTSSDEDSFFCKPTYKAPRSHYELVFPSISIGSTSAARTTILRYIGPPAAQSGTMGIPAASTAAIVPPAPPLAILPGASGSSSNPIDLTNDSEDEDDEEVDYEAEDENSDEEDIDNDTDADAEF